MDCAAVVSADGCEVSGRAENLSDGGVLVRLTQADAPRGPIAGVEKVCISLPRCTPNTRMVERISSAASVVRRTADGRIALRFASPLALVLEA